MIYQIKKNFTLIGKTIIKPEKSFSFNAYLLTGEQNVLIDTVPEKASAVFWEEVESIVPIEKLDALILNHSEEDHSGALPHLLNSRPDIPIYCTPNCAKRLSITYPDAKNWIEIRTGEVLRFGEEQIFHFFETPGLHWDDNMVTYWENEKILFSNDLFGQSLGSDTPIDKEVQLATLENAVKEYYHKVFSEATITEKQVIRKLNELPIECLAPGHGVIIRERMNDMMKWYEELI